MNNSYKKDTGQLKNQSIQLSSGVNVHHTSQHGLAGEDCIEEGQGESGKGRKEKKT